jgi:hypothetical protein
MAIVFDPKQIVLNEELLISQVVQQEAIIRRSSGNQEKEESRSIGRRFLGYEIDF